jgi:hypothetical protein
MDQAYTHNWHKVYQVFPSNFAFDISSSENNYYFIEENNNSLQVWRGRTSDGVIDKLCTKTGLRARTKLARLEI